MALGLVLYGTYSMYEDRPIFDDPSLYDQSYDQVDPNAEDNDYFVEMSIRWMNETKQEGFFLPPPPPLEAEIGPFGETYSTSVFADRENGLEHDFTKMRSVMQYLSTLDYMSKYELAEKVVEFSNQLSGTYYIYDSENPETTESRFETLKDVLDQGQNDCDGLALLTQQLLIDAGFDQGEIYFTIINNMKPFEAGHALISWMPEGSDDPLLIDSTNVFDKPIYVRGTWILSAFYQKP